jgi:hypothetical protein
MDYMCPSLSRDGSLLIGSSDEERNGKHIIRIYDFARGTSTRITDGGAEKLSNSCPTARQWHLVTVMPAAPFPAAVEDRVVVYKELLKTHEARNIGL